MIITVASSPYPEDYIHEVCPPPPWSYEEVDFISWVNEVFREGYKRDNPHMTLEEAITLLREYGYEVVCENESE